MEKYKIDKTRIGRFTLFTIWDEETQRPLYDFSSQDFGLKNAKKRSENALKKLQELNKSPSGKE